MKQNVIVSLPLVSVVIPFYNVENYLAECLNSLIRQTYGIENLEVILIDDLGQDTSTHIAKTYVSLLGENAQLIIHKENKGLGGARNTGINAASGEYIMFIDSDDFIDGTTIETLVKILQKDQSDIAIYNMHSFSELNKTYPLNPSYDLFKQMNADSMKINRYEFPKYPELAHSFSACNKLFSKKLFTIDKRFPEKQHHEDALLISSLLADSKAISLVRNVYYRYRQRESVSDKSITDTLFETKEHFFEHVQIVEGLKQITLKYPELEYMLLWVSLRIMGTPIKNLLSNNTSLNKEEENEFYERTKNILVNREIKGTYAVGDKIAKFAIDVAMILVESHTLEEARKKYQTASSSKTKNMHQATKYDQNPNQHKKFLFHRKLKKLKNNPKLYFKDLIYNKTKSFRK